MKRVILLMAVVFGLSAIMASCGDGDGTAAKEPAKKEVKREAPAPKPEPAPADDLAAQMKLGEKIYQEKCIVCHMADGKGVPGAFPPLAKSDYLLADPVRAVAQTLNGSHEEMIVNGVTYNAPMTPQVDTKEDAVAIINYVMKNFGNDGPIVTIEDVKDVVVAPR